MQRFSAHAWLASPAKKTAAFPRSCLLLPRLDPSRHVLSSRNRRFGRWARAGPLGAQSPSSGYLCRAATRSSLPASRIARLDASKLVGEDIHVLYDTGVQPFEDWEEFEPHTCSKKARVAIRGIAGVRNIMTPNVSLHVGLPSLEHGANPVAVEGWKHAQVPRTCAPKDAHEHRLGAVIRVVPGGNSLRAGAARRGL